MGDLELTLVFVAFALVFSFGVDALTGELWRGSPKRRLNNILRNLMWPMAMLIWEAVNFHLKPLDNPAMEVGRAMFILLLPIAIPCGLASRYLKGKIDAERKDDLARQGWLEIKMSEDKGPWKVIFIPPNEYGYTHDRYTLEQAERHQRLAKRLQGQHDEIHRRLMETKPR